MKKAFYPKLHLAIDGNEANIFHRVGSNAYAFYILDALNRLIQKQVNPKVVVTVLLARPPVKDLPLARDSWRYQVIGPKPFWTQLALPWYLLNHQDQFDLFFTPGHYGPSLSPVPLVSSVMDLAFLDYPDQFRLSDKVKLELWTKQTVKKAKKIITISRFSKIEVMKHYHRRQKDVVVAYPAVKPIKRLSQKKRLNYLKKAKLKRPYFLYLGTLQPRKNLTRLVKAYELFLKLALVHGAKGKRQAQLPDLVIAGKVGWMADEILTTINQSSAKRKIKLLGFVPESDKPYLIASALASVQVGLYEGFGMPVLESYQLGVPVVTSNTSSLPEAAGKAGIYVKPTCTKDIAEGLLTAYSLSTRKRQQLKKLMKAHLAQFSWEKSAQTILETLIEVYKNSA